MSKQAMLDTINPEISFRNGANVSVGKRNVRRFNGTLCVSASGKLWAITPTGPKSAIVDKAGPYLHDFGGSKAAMGKVEGVPGAQEIAPVVTLASLGIDRPAKPATKAVAPAVDHSAEIAELRESVSVMTQMLAAYMKHEQ